MEDERWTTKDKLDQYRGVTALYNNTSTNIKEKLSLQRKKQNKEISNLTAQNKKYRLEYEEVLHGDKKNLLPVLNAHPTLQSAFKNLNPQEIEEELKQSIFCKRKELDRLRYKKKNLEKTYLNKKLELAGLQKEAEELPENYLWEQEIANQIQSVSVKLNEARANQAVYGRAFNILQKDAIRFDEVLEGLRQDLKHQCESIVKAVEMGQAVSEELGSLGKEYRATEKAVRANMRTRDRAIRTLKAEIDGLRTHQYLATRESVSQNALATSAFKENGDLGDDEDMENILEAHIKREIKIVEETLDQIKEAAMVHRIQDICPRMDEQKKQKLHLQKQVAENEEELSRMMELRNQLDVMLEVVLYHTMTDEANRMKEERLQLRKEIELESENLKDNQEEVVNIGKKIMDVRTCLLTLNMMLDTVYPIPVESSMAELSMISEILPETPGQVKPLVQPNCQALTLMEQVTKKVNWLMDQVKSENKKARSVPTSVPTVQDPSALQLAVDDEADNIVSDMLDELEDMDDPSVLTRKEIKAESQRIVDLYDNPRAMFQDNNQPKFKKHKCF